VDKNAFLEQNFPTEIIFSTDYNLGRREGGQLVDGSWPIFKILLMTQSPEKLLLCNY